jgi:hypothetical protein
MNQNLLSSYSSSSIRLPSPISEDEEDILNSRVQEEEDILNLDVPHLSPIHGFHFPDPHCPTFMVLPTNFDINANQNKKVPYPQGEDQKEDHIAYTDKQRVLAGEAIVSKDIL